MKKPTKTASIEPVTSLDKYRVTFYWGTYGIKCNISFIWLLGYLVEIPQWERGRGRKHHWSTTQHSEKPRKYPKKGREALTYGFMTSILVTPGSHVGKYTRSSSNFLLLLNISTQKGVAYSLDGAQKSLWIFWLIGCTQKKQETQTCPKWCCLFFACRVFIFQPFLCFFPSMFLIKWSLYSMLKYFLWLLPFLTVSNL